MNKFFICMSMALLFIVSSCSTVSVATDYDKDANFQNLKTYAFYAKGLKEIKMNDLDKRRVVKAITGNLESKGFSVISNEKEADVLINIIAKTEKRVEVNPWYDSWYGPWGYGAYWARPMVREYKEGTLVIDFVDRRNNILIWEGMGSGLNLYNLSQKAERIPEAVNEILTNYPPK